MPWSVVPSRPPTVFVVLISLIRPEDESRKINREVWVTKKSMDGIETDQCKVDDEIDDNKDNGKE